MVLFVAVHPDAVNVVVFLCYLGQFVDGSHVDFGHHFGDERLGALEEIGTDMFAVLAEVREELGFQTVGVGIRLSEVEASFGPFGI